MSNRHQQDEVYLAFKARRNAEELARFHRMGPREYDDLVRELKQVSQDPVGWYGQRNNNEETDMNVIAQLAAFNKDRATVDELVGLAVHVELVKEGYENRDVPVPEAIVDGIEMLNREILSRQSDEIAKRLKELAAADAADRSADERKKDRALERERLQARLAGKKPETQPV